MHIEDKKLLNRLSMLDICANGEIDTFKELISASMFDDMQTFYGMIHETCGDILPTNITYKASVERVEFTASFNQGESHIFSVQRLEKERRV